MHHIYCSTGALIGRPNLRDYRLIVDCAGQIDCDGFELLMYEDWYEDFASVGKRIHESGLHFPVLHVEKQVGELISRNQPGDTERALELFEINCQMARFVDAHLLVLHLWSGLDSDKNIAHNVEAYRDLRDVASRYDLTLTVENVVCNNADPFSHLFLLADTYPDIKFTFDTKMAQFHGQLEQLYTAPTAWTSAHIAHMHINDYGGGYKEWAKLSTLHLGDGVVDFARLFEYVRENYTGDFTVEATSFDKAGTIYCDRVNDDIRRIREYLD